MNFISTIYGLAVKTKNSLYDHGLLSQARLRGPVVSVGNLSVGGSGKTPFVILLAEQLQRRGVPLDVLSRGYGRKSRGVLAVDPKGSAADFGDEPLLIARWTGCPVIVGEDRLAAGRFAERKFGPQLHILDDGFQHRALARDVDIVLLAAEDTHEGLLPAGRLREPLSSLARADEVILTGDFEDHELPPKLRPSRLRRSVSVENPPAQPVVFCGIARPRAFVEQLRGLGISPVAERFYRDHHSYTPADIQELERLRDRHHADGFITTEKDAINLEGMSGLGNLAIARVVLQVEPADALDTMLSVIAGLRPTA